MELGEKLLQARHEAGLSQRQLCGDRITRNMLSQIEHGIARPSMDTLRYLAEKLGKPVSFFLEEHVVTSPNQELMVRAREGYSAGEMTQAWGLLKAFQQPDPVLEWEWRYLSAMTAMATARQAMEEKRYPYARQLLEEAEVHCRRIPALERQRLLLLGKNPDVNLPEIIGQLPSLDEELRLRAEEAIMTDQPERAAALLMAAQDWEDPEWNLLRGKSLLLQKQYAAAAACFEKAEETYPNDCWVMLERCYRDLGDFQKAYVYACKQRQMMI